MKDMVTNGTGNSRYLKSSLASGTSWADALAMLRAGTFPIDLNGLNQSGIAQVGSAYSKANVLPQDVCTTLGLSDNSAEPKDAFLAIVDAIGDHHYVWNQYNYVAQHSSLGAEMDEQTIWSSSSDYGANAYITYSYSDTISVAEDGTVTLDDPSDVNVYKTSGGTYGPTDLAGNYFRYKAKAPDPYGSAVSTALSTTKIYYWPENATYRTPSLTIRVTGLKEVTGVSAHDASIAGGVIAQVTSDDQSSYPMDGKSGNYWYVCLGLVQEKTQIIAGTYVGTGTYGSGNANSLTFLFPPMLVIIERETPNSTFVYYFTAVNGVSKIHVQPGDKSAQATLTWDNNNISWYGTNATNQFNENGINYHYVAVG